MTINYVHLWRSFAYFKAIGLATLAVNLCWSCWLAAAHGIEFHNMCCHYMINIAGFCWLFQCKLFQLHNYTSKFALHVTYALTLGIAYVLTLHVAYVLTLHYLHCNYWLQDKKIHATMLHFQLHVTLQYSISFDVVKKFTVIRLLLPYHMGKAENKFLSTWNTLFAGSCTY